MGLDMYLNKKMYVGGNYECTDAKGSITWGKGKDERTIKAKDVSEIISQVGYWRKANQIHNWFVANVQDGNDECQESQVSFNTLMELKNVCDEVLNDHTKAVTLLPTGGGCFFGSTEYSEGYFQELEETVEILNKLTDDGEYIYQASW